MSMGTRLATALEVRKLTPPDLISAAKLAKGTVYNILNDATKPEKVWAETVRRICECLRIDRDWLLWGRGDMEARAEAANDGDWRDIRGYSQAVGLGRGAEAQEYAETHGLKFRQDSLRRKNLDPKGLHVMYGDGDSMLPRIRPGDAVMFDTASTRIEDGALYVVQWKGELFVKRAEVVDDLVLFKSDNPAGDHVWRKAKRMDSPRDPITVLGRVRWIGSWE